MSRKRRSNSRRMTSKELIRRRLREAVSSNKKRRERKGPGKSKPLYRIEDGITFSLLSSYIDNPEECALSYLDGLTPKRVSIPLEFGSLFHSCVEHQYTHKNETPLQVVRKINKAYKTLRKKTLFSTTDKDTLECLTQLVEATFPPYCEYWKEEDAQVTWVNREDKFNVNYNVRVPDSNPINIRLRGMRDGVIRVYGKLGIFETKTKSRINELEIKDSLKADMQTMIYLLATYIEYGEFPETVLYNVVRRSSIYRRKNESVKDYIDRISEDMRKRPSYYFMRWESTVTKEDLQDFLHKTLNPLLIQFSTWYNSVKKNPQDRFQSQYHFLNSNALFGKYGRSDMWDAIHGNFRPYRIRTVVFPELEESSLVLE